MDLTKPAVYPCWERFADNEKRFVNDETEYNALCSLHGKPIIYVMLSQQKQALADVDAVISIENQEIVETSILKAVNKKGVTFCRQVWCSLETSILKAVNKKGGQWKKPR